MTANYTPGPWHVSTDEDLWPVVMGAGKIIANVNPESFFGGVADLIELPAESNAKLIAAAPELLAALDRIANMKDRDGNEIELHREEMRAIARSAITKATKG